MNERMLQLATLSAANTRLVAQNVGLKSLITELADECKYQHWLRTRPWPRDIDRLPAKLTDTCEQEDCLCCERIQKAREAVK
jgi:hypothetical protein